AISSVYHDLPALVVPLEMEQNGLRSGHGAEAKHHSRLQALDTGPITQECVVGIDHQRAVVPPAANLREWIGQHGIPERTCKSRQAPGKLWVVLWSAHDQATSGGGELLRQAAEHGRVRRPSS